MRKLRSVDDHMLARRDPGLQIGLRVADPFEAAIDFRDRDLQSALPDGLELRVEDIGPRTYKSATADLPLGHLPIRLFDHAILEFKLCDLSLQILSQHIGCVEAIILLDVQRAS
jgi:hypothetical protein